MTNYNREILLSDDKFQMRILKDNGTFKIYHLHPQMKT